MDFKTGPKIDARRNDYVKPGGNVAVIFIRFKIKKQQIFLNFDTFFYRKTKIFSEKPKFNTGPRIDARKDDYNKPGGTVAVNSFQPNYRHI